MRLFPLARDCHTTCVHPAAMADLTSSALAGTWCNVLCVVRHRFPLISVLDECLRMSFAYGHLMHSSYSSVCTLCAGTVIAPLFVVVSFCSVLRAKGDVRACFRLLASVVFSAASSAALRIGACNGERSVRSMTLFVGTFAQTCFWGLFVRGFRVGARGCRCLGSGIA